MIQMNVFVKQRVLLVLSPVSLFAIPWTVALQAPLSIGFPRQEYWSGLSFLSPGSLSNRGIKSASPASARGLFTTEQPGKPIMMNTFVQSNRIYNTKSEP